MLIKAKIEVAIVVEEERPNLELFGPYQGYSVVAALSLKRVSSAR